MVGTSGKEITHELRGRRDNDTVPDPRPGTVISRTCTVFNSRILKLLQLKFVFSSFKWAD